MREDCCLNGAGSFLLNTFMFSMLHISLSAGVAAPRPTHGRGAALAKNTG